MRIFAQANYPFIARRRIAYALSAVAIAIGLAPMVVNGLAGKGWVNYGIDFEGGVLLQVRFAGPMTTDRVRSALRGTPVSEIAGFRETSEFVIRAPLGADSETERTRDLIAERLTSAFGAGSFSVERTELVGPKVGGELQQRAAFAIGLSFLLTLVYLAFRFEPRFGLAAIIATGHDILITLGFIAAFRLDVGLSTVAAILTVVGYSLNDTIVVFDRIREKLKGARGRSVDERELINRAINETLPRTVLTSGTTVAVLLPLYVLGGMVLREFAAVLLLGIIVGTFSSIFVASPALLALRAWHRPARRTAAETSIKGPRRHPASSGTRVSGSRPGSTGSGKV